MGAVESSSDVGTAIDRNIIAQRRAGIDFDQAITATGTINELYLPEATDLLDIVEALVHA